MPHSSMLSQTPPSMPSQNAQTPSPTHFVRVPPTGLQLIDRDKHCHRRMRNVRGHPHSLEHPHPEGCNSRAEGEGHVACLVTMYDTDHSRSQLFTVGLHELFHLAAGLLCGGQVVSICIDPNDGGATHVMGLMRTTPRIPRDPYAMPTYPQLFWSPSALITLSSGYIGSSIIGFLFVFCGFDIVASKACVLVIHFGLLVPIMRADHWIAFASIVVCEAVLVGLWFGDHGNALRFYVIFVGMMNLFYVVWDYIDERLFDKRNTSDCAQFSELLGWPTSSWAILWFIYDVLVFTSAIFAGIIVFRRTDDQMYAETAKFLPTR
ncbi:hypothetical protein L202_07441 [Cryptococcus amylolentus CBS 6039]|uniref:Peptidase M50B-like-domain-containing protein n=1 Tax=Cryptococcus amylolentus CBS 6039 TaxID=1295533 RepID=A0A1E3HCT8_9TREE|nr:hypothetical protein L202_07441 [Cryptococcus amylolentus CBS 6039]ODN73935.1 hypothetical protein L202_07441 [Cryptococcus amylolentus CBS 6039]